MGYSKGISLRLLSWKGGYMSEVRRIRRANIAPKSKFKEMEEVLLNGGDSKDIYALIPPRQRKAFEMFARCFGIKKEDIERIAKGS